MTEIHKSSPAATAVLYMSYIVLNYVIFFQNVLQLERKMSLKSRKVVLTGPLKSYNLISKFL